MSTGKPSVFYRTRGSAVVEVAGHFEQFSVTDSSNPLTQEFNVQLAQEASNLEEDISDYELYPVIKLGVGYRF